MNLCSGARNRYVLQTAFLRLTDGAHSLFCLEKLQLFIQLATLSCLNWPAALKAPVQRLHGKHLASTTSDLLRTSFRVDTKSHYKLKNVLKSPRALNGNATLCVRTMTSSTTRPSRVSRSQCQHIQKQQAAAAAQGLTQELCVCVSAAAVERLWINSRYIPAQVDEKKVQANCAGIPRWLIALH